MSFSFRMNPDDNEKNFIFPSADEILMRLDNDERTSDRWNKEKGINKHMADRFGGKRILGLGVLNILEQEFFDIQEKHMLPTIAFNVFRVAYKRVLIECAKNE